MKIFLTSSVLKTLILPIVLLSYITLIYVRFVIKLSNSILPGICVKANKYIFELLFLYLTLTPFIKIYSNLKLQRKRVHYEKENDYSFSAGILKHWVLPVQ